MPNPESPQDLPADPPRGCCPAANGPDQSPMKSAYYKYRPLWRSGALGCRKPDPFTRSIFKKAEIFFSTPKDFNDPFDCNLRLHVRDSTDEDWTSYCEEIARQRPDMRAKFETIKRKRLWRTEPSISQGIGVSTHRTYYEQSSVLCLSTKKNSIPMFSYYADSHRGIAIEFRFLGSECPCGIPYEDLTPSNIPWGGKITMDHVDYPERFPELNYHRLYNDTQMIKSLLFTKHQNWKHESEFRIVRRGIPASSAPFDRSLLTQVIFGCRTVPADVALVKHWLVGWPSDVVLSRAEPAATKFDLEIREFDCVRATPKHQL